MMIRIINICFVLFFIVANSQNIAGDYYPIDSKCKLNLKIDSKNNFFFNINNRKEIKGIVKISKEDNTTYLNFGIVSSMYDNDTISIQNSGNEMNPYWHFKDCDEKYIHLIKKTNNLIIDKKIVPLSKTYKLGFNTYSKEFKMYQKPFILKGKRKYKIQGYDSENYSGGNILSISPNKKYIVIDYISKGYVDDGTNTTLYENYLCVIIDVNKKKVIKEMQEDCGGKWNKKNQWDFWNYHCRRKHFLEINAD